MPSTALPTSPDQTAGAADAAEAAAEPGLNCLNCEEPLGPPRPNYCPQCGQDTHLKPPTLREFAQQFGGSYIAIEGALWRSLKLLLFKPGALTREYLDGRRRRYVLPLRLYLTISVLVLLLFQLNAEHAVKIDAKDLPAAKASQNGTVSMGFGRAGLKNGVFFCDGLPVWLCKRIQRRLDVEPQALAAQTAELGERFAAHLGSAMFLLLPSLALWLKLAYWNRRLHYTEHLVAVLHLHSFWFLMLALILTDVAALALPALLAVPLYGLLAMKRIYGGRWGPLVLRALFVSALYSIVLVLALTLVGLWAFLG